MADFSCKTTGGLFNTYKEYLNSDIWKERRELFLETKSFCELCGVEKIHIKQIFVCYKIFYKGLKDLLIMIV